MKRLLCMQQHYTVVPTVWYKGRLGSQYLLKSISMQCASVLGKVFHRVTPHLHFTFYKCLLYSCSRVRVVLRDIWLNKVPKGGSRKFWFKSTKLTGCPCQRSVGLSMEPHLPLALTQDQGLSYVASSSQYPEGKTLGSTPHI